MSNEKFKTGLTSAEVEAARAQYGLNVLTPPPNTPWWKLYLEKFDDPIIKILCAAAILSVITSYFDGSWAEPVGIIMAIVLSTGLAFWMEMNSKKNFEILNKVSDTEKVKVIRDGETCLVPKDQLVPGDIVILATGDEVPADLELFEAIDLKIEEASMTGESMPVSKKAKDKPEPYDGSGFAPWSALRSTRVMEGSGKGVVVAIGDNTEVGKITRAALEDNGLETPLQMQLNRLAGLINKAGFTLSAVLLMVLVGKYLMIQGYLGKDIFGISGDILGIVAIICSFLIAVVPEGISAANTIALSLAMKAMAKRKVLVKSLLASETIGSINLIASDKTGTLSEGRFSVVETHVSKDFTLQSLLEGAAINSSASLDSEKNTVGNLSEGAMLRFIESKEQSWKEMREAAVVIEVKPFNSTDKYMSTKVSDGTVYVKGAPEIIAKMTGKDGQLIIVKEQQARGRRAISLAQGTSMEDLKYVGTYFMEDPVRPDVPDSVKAAYRAGIDVMMITGDAIDTASEIAKQAGFNRKIQGDPNRDIWAVEAKDFIEVSKAHPFGQTPNVVARCKPQDKLEIVRYLQSRGKICAVTGDGTNDAPALRESQIGISMGITGTSVAKTAADMILLEDDFPSIITGVMFGRSLMKRISAFLVFQLTINVALCLISLISPIIGHDLPFSVLDILVLNLTMDSIGSFCLASEPADESVLSEKPRDQKKFIVTPELWKIIAGYGVAIAVALIIMVWNNANPGFLPFETDSSVIFATFMMICFWNLFGLRTLGINRSIFYNFKESRKFLIGAIFVFLSAILSVQLGGEVFETHPLSLIQWFWIIIGTSVIMWAHEIQWRLTRR